MDCLWAGLATALLISISSEASAGARSPAARADFVRLNPCPATGSPKPSHRCPGFVVDHITPLCLGGADHYSNMQWQSTEDAKRKDADELRACRAIKQ